MKPVGFYLIPRMLLLIAKDLLVFVGMVVVCVAMVALLPVVFVIFFSKIITLGLFKSVSLLLRYMIKLTKGLNELFILCGKFLDYDRERAGEY